MENKELLVVDGFMWIICFLIPPVAWMLYAFNAATSPKAAKKCMVASLLGYVIAIVIVATVIIYNYW